MPRSAEAEVFNGPFYQFAVPHKFSDLDIPSMSEVAASHIEGVAVMTSVFHSEALSTEHASVHIKDETRQLGKCFKVRGALNAIATYHEQGLTDFETSSGGSYAIAVGIAAQQYGCSVEAVVSEATPLSRQTTIRNHGAELIVHGRNFNAAHEYAKTRARELDRTYLHPFANPWTIAGQATIGRELVEQAPDMTTLVLPVGGGSLLAGAASVVRQHLPDVRIVAAQVERCTAYVDSLRMARRQVATDVDTRFGGLAVSRTNPLTLALGSRLVDQVIVLDSRLVYETVDIYKEHEGVLLDETGATGVAATRYLASLATNGDEKFVTVATGANPDPDLRNYAAAVARRLAYERQTTVLANATC